MTKQQAILYCKEKAEYEGYIIHTMLLELWENGEEIPNDIMELICYPPKPPQPFVLYLSESGYKYMQNVLELYETDLVQSEIMENIKNLPYS